MTYLNVGKSKVEFIEFLHIVEILTHRIGFAGVLVENMKVHLIRPPVPVRRTVTECLSASYRAVFHVTHKVPSSWLDEILADLKKV